MLLTVLRVIFGSLFAGTLVFAIYILLRPLWNSKCCHLRFGRNLFCQKERGANWWYCYDHRGSALARIAKFAFTFAFDTIGLYLTIWPPAFVVDPLRDHLQHVSFSSLNGDAEGLANFNKPLPGELKFTQFCESLRDVGTCGVSFSVLPGHGATYLHLKAVREVFPNLIHLDLDHNKEIAADGEGAAAVDVIRSLEKLQTLRLTDTGIKTADFLPALPDLQKVSLSDTTISKGDIAQSTNLTEICAVDCHIDSASIDALKHLEKLHMTRGSMPWIDLKGPRALQSAVLESTNTSYVTLETLTKLTEFLATYSPDLLCVGIIGSPELDRCTIARNSSLLLLCMADCGSPSYVWIQDNPQLACIYIANTSPRSTLVIRNLPALKLVAVSDEKVLRRLSAQSRRWLRENEVRVLVGGEERAW